MIEDSRLKIEYGLNYFHHLQLLIPGNPQTQALTAGSLVPAGTTRAATRPARSSTGPSGTTRASAGTT
jgi:hypothetical protein